MISLTLIRTGPSNLSLNEESGSNTVGLANWSPLDVAAERWTGQG